jgi:Na+/melibiose symporter-like transporter
MLADVCDVDELNTGHRRQAFYSAVFVTCDKMAMAVAVTMAATAGTGGMKNVTGTSNAVAIVAVNPGMAPTKRPYTADAAMTAST